VNRFKHLVQIYGWMRTGTGHAGVLIVKNFADTVVSRSGKHDGPETPAGETYTAARHRATLVDVPGADLATAGGYELLVSLTDAELKRCQELHQSGGVKFVICTKNPLAWAVSFRRALARDDAPGPGWELQHPPLDPLAPVDYAQYIRGGYNAAHKRYSTVLAANPNRCLLVRHEDLIEDGFGVVGKIWEKLNLEPKYSSTFVGPGTSTSLGMQVLGETSWSNSLYGKSATPIPFDRSFYTENKYLDYFSEAQAQAVLEAVDWETLESFGYTREGCERLWARHTA
jgi:hypothetical protein